MINEFGLEPHVLKLFEDLNIRIDEKNVKIFEKYFIDTGKKVANLIIEDIQKEFINES